MFTLLKSLITEDDETASGLYAAVKFDDETIDALKSYCVDNGINNPLPPVDFHSTTLYSEGAPDIKPLGVIDPPFVASFNRFEVWPSEDKNVLVMVLDSPDLVDRHEYYMDNGATHSYPDYTPHITLSYDAGEVDPSELPPFESEVVIVKEYMEPLNTSL